MKVQEVTARDLQWDTPERAWVPADARVLIACAIMDNRFKKCSSLIVADEVIAGLKRAGFSIKLNPRRKANIEVMEVE